MSKEWKIRLLKYGVAVLGGGLLFAMCLWLQEFSTDLSLQDQYRILCNGFFTGGAMLFLLGCLVWVSTEGALDGVAWAVINLGKSLIPGLGGTKESYQDYVARKTGKRIKGYGFLFYTGIVFLLAAAVFLFLFMRMEA